MDIFSYLLGKNTAGGGGGGSSKFTFEEGTWTPTEDTLQGEIRFSKSHSKTPTLVSLIDIGDNVNTDAIVCFEYTDFYQLYGETMTNKNGLSYRFACNVLWEYSATSSLSNGGIALRYGPNTIVESYTKDYARYYVDEQKFYPTMNSTSRYWRANRTYKWIAIWTDE